MSNLFLWNILNFNFRLNLLMNCGALFGCKFDFLQIALGNDDETRRELSKPANQDPIKKVRIATTKFLVFIDREHCVKNDPSSSITT